jgi:hypothetical protein
MVGDGNQPTPDSKSDKSDINDISDINDKSDIFDFIVTFIVFTTSGIFIGFITLKNPAYPGNVPGYFVQRLSLATLGEDPST